MSAITSTERLIATFIGAVVAGMYLCTFFYCIRWLVYADEGWRIRERINKTMLSGVLAIFILCGVYMGFAVFTSAVAIRNAERGIPVNADVPLPWTAVLECTVKNVAVLITDGFLIYRCWLICWKSIPMVLVPCFFWVGGLVCTILQGYWQIVQSASIPNVWTPVNMSQGPGTILLPFWGTTIVVNIYCTSVIVYTLWKNTREESELSESTSYLNFIMRVIIESGVIYSLVTIPHFIVWWTPNSFAIQIMGLIQLPIIGSGFNLIVVRTSQHRIEMVEAEKLENFATSAIQFGRTTFHSDNIKVHAKDNTSETTRSYSTSGYAL